jgi:hypothetical protein
MALRAPEKTEPEQRLTHGSQCHMEKAVRTVECPDFSGSERNILAGEAFAFCFFREKSFFPFREFAWMSVGFDARGGWRLRTKFAMR